MKPALLMVCDPAEGKASALLEGMLAALPDARSATWELASGSEWAVAAIAPPVGESTCGTYVLDTPTDLLIWAGEIILPSTWWNGSEPRTHEAVSRIIVNHLRNDGLELLAQIDGGFCAAWYDRVQARWLIFNDKMGQIPLFWAAEEPRLVVSSQAWLTWRGIGTPLQISSTAVADMIRTQNMTEDHTLIEGVHWLPRSHALSWGHGGVGYCRYWEFNYEGEQIENEDEALDLYLQSITSTMQRNAAGKSNLMLGISGGLDSRIFLAVCEQIGRVPHCFTSGWPFYEDVRFGRKLARVAGAAHDFLQLEEAGLGGSLEQAIIDTDGLQSAAHLSPIVPIRPYLRQHTGSVLLEGFFHGLVGGCAVPSEDDAAAHHTPHKSRWARATLHSGGAFAAVNDLLKPSLARDSQQEWDSRIDRVFRSAPARDAVGQAEYTMVHGRMGRVDVLGTGLLRPDVLLRNPASDRLMLDWHQRVSPRLRRGRAIYLAALRRAFPRFARVQRADGCGALPISTDRLQREYAWQLDRAHRLYASLRFPMARRWGTSSAALRAWAFDVWKRSGRLDVLIDPSARILNWTRRDAVMELWASADASPKPAVPLLTLATIEVMCRWLETQSGRPLVSETQVAIVRQRNAQRRHRVNRKTETISMSV